LKKLVLILVLLLIGSFTIYSKNVIALTDEMNFDNYRNFPQFSLIYHYLSMNCSFYWVNEKIVSSNKKKISYWAGNIFSVFIDDWSDAVHNLPVNYDNKIQESVIIDHSIKSNIFNIKSIFYLRSLGFYNWRKYKKYAHILSLHSNLSEVTLFVIALSPIWVISAGYKIVKKIKLKQL